MTRGKWRLSACHSAESEDFPHMTRGKRRLSALRHAESDIVILLIGQVPRILLRKVFTFRYRICGKWRLSACHNAESLHFPHMTCGKWRLSAYHTAEIGHGLKRIKKVENLVTLSLQSLKMQKKHLRTTSNDCHWQTGWRSTRAGWPPGDPTPWLGGGGKSDELGKVTSWEKWRAGWPLGDPTPWLGGGGKSDELVDRQITTRWGGGGGVDRQPVC